MHYGEVVCSVKPSKMFNFPGHCEMKLCISGENGPVLWGRGLHYSMCKRGNLCFELCSSTCQLINVCLATAQKNTLFLLIPPPPNQPPLIRGMRTSYDIPVIACVRGVLPAFLVVLSIRQWVIKNRIKRMILDFLGFECTAFWSPC